MDGTAGTDGLPVGVIAEPFSYCVPCLHKGAKGKTGEGGERGDKGDKVKKKGGVCLRHVETVFFPGFIWSQRKERTGRS